jgi:Ca-activated chloride channel family protein
MLTILGLILLAGGMNQEDRPIRLGTTLVNTFLTVSNKQGEFVSHLDASDFIIQDNGVRQRITEFNRETQLPLTLAMVFDRSRSVQEQITLQQTAATRFLTSILRKGQDQGLLIAFDSNIYLLQDFTDDPTALTNKIHNLSVAGNSAVFDAVYKTARDRFTGVRQSRKVLILITDGDDTASEVTLDQAIDMALRTDVIVYAIAIKGTKAGASALTRLTQATGGRVLFLNEESSDLAGLFNQLDQELRTQYSIGFQLNTPPDGRFHRLAIRTKKRGLTVRARRGYYALPPAGPSKTNQ